MQVLPGSRLHALAGPRSTGWTAKGAGVLVALAARFSYGGSSDALLAHFGAISTLKGLRYWSVTEGGWRTLITSATALSGPDLDHPRPDFTLAEMRSGKELYFAQGDSRAAGDVVYRMRVGEVSPTRLIVAIENVTPSAEIYADAVQPGRFAVAAFSRAAGPQCLELLRPRLGGRDYGIIARGAGSLLCKSRQSVL